ncbi:MAG: PDC sensor domain-containing protein [Cocleimonas sp.]|nr:PDC sensor domain-containing protein [Cocleimonas sp.]
MDSTLKQSVKHQRELLTLLLGGTLANFAIELAPLMDDSNALNNHLVKAINDLPYCKYLYVLDSSGKQISGTVKHDGIKLEDIGRDRSSRPYMENMFVPRLGVDFELSSAYISSNKKRPSLTGVQLIRNYTGERLGFLGVDYDLRELPREDKMYEEPRQWRQIKGDPAIRGGLFSQQRVESQMDTKLEDVMTILEELMLEHGVYHCQIHYSSSRVTIWHVDDPYTYRILTMDELSDTEICLAYPKRPYFDRNIVPKKNICNVFKQFSALRFADETIYLRSGSLNLVNGFVGLNFSCDGTHYLTYDDFLNRGLEFWFGATTETDEAKAERNETNTKNIDMKQLDNIIEDIAQLGCLEVNQIIRQLDAGNTPANMSELESEEQQYIHSELKSVMAIYDGGVCSI